MVKSVNTNKSSSPYFSLKMQALMATIIYLHAKVGSLR